MPITKLAEQFKAAGGMESEAAIDLLEQLADACDNAPDHWEAVQQVQTIVPNFNY